MTDLIDYIRQHTEQIAHGGTDMAFFRMKAVGEPRAEVLRNWIIAHQGVFGEVNPLDGKEHSYLELGGWVGDQGLALMLMGLGTHLGLWKLNTPKSVLGDLVTDEQAMKLAGGGLVTIQTEKADG